MSRSHPFRFRHLPARQQFTLAIAALSVLWTLFVLIFGGIDTSVLGVRVRSHDWSRPAIVAVVSLLVFVRLRRGSYTRAVRSSRAIAAAAVRWLRAPDNLLLIAILLVAAIARLWALGFGLPHPAARPDEEAVGAMAGSYYDGNFEQTIFTYPPLFILVVAGALWIVSRDVSSTLSWMNIRLGLSDPSTAAERIVARFLSAAAGVASVWLLFRIGTRLFGRPTAFVAAACLALAFLHVRDSHFGVTDVPMTCMVLVGFLAIVKLSESGSRRDLVAAGIWTGLAVATKYNAALLVLPACFAILNDPLRRPIRIRLGRAVAFAAIMAAAFVIVCPFAVLSYEKFLADLMDVSRHLADGHGPDLGRGWTYHLTTTLRYGLGLPLLAAGILGLPLMVWREGRRGILVALFPVAYYALIGSGRTVFARYALPLVPFLCLSGWIPASRPSAVAVTNYLRRPAWRIPATTVITAAVLWPSHAVGHRFRSPDRTGGQPRPRPSLDRSALCAWNHDCAARSTERSSVHLLRDRLPVVRHDVDAQAHPRHRRLVSVRITGSRQRLALAGARVRSAVRSTGRCRRRSREHLRSAGRVFRASRRLPSDRKAGAERADLRPSRRSDVFMRVEAAS